MLVLQVPILIPKQCIMALRATRIPVLMVPVFPRFQVSIPWGPRAPNLPTCRRCGTMPLTQEHAHRKARQRDPNAPLLHRLPLPAPIRQRPKTTEESFLLPAWLPLGRSCEDWPMLQSSGPLRSVLGTATALLISVPADLEILRPLYRRTEGRAKPRVALGRARPSRGNPVRRSGGRCTMPLRDRRRSPMVMTLCLFSNCGRCS